MKAVPSQFSVGPAHSVGVTLQPRGLKLRAACEYIGGVSEITMRRLIDRGVIKPNRATRHLIIPVSQLDQFLDRDDPKRPRKVKEAAAVSLTHGIG